ncbi:MAG: hypothetical protein HYZ37_12295 [Candidatus Solibacter usitatus]|nr:hypothetical protein [Candidatus Solibacter usitatus]
MFPLSLFAVLACAQQLPEPVRFTAGSQSVAYYHQPGDAPAVLLILPNQPETPAAEWKSWQAVAASRKWHLVFPSAGAVGDAGVKLLEAITGHLRAQPALGKAAIYLAGGGGATPMVFYGANRAPHLFSAALAIGGSPAAAIETDRIFGANTNNLPIAWAVSPQEKSAASDSLYRLNVGGYKLEILESPSTAQALDFLAKAGYNPLPRSIDCETGNPAFARCYWITPVAFDGNLRNDIVRATKIQPGSMASLDFGGFGFAPDKPGPGIVVEFLPPKYSGPLKLNDRIVALSGSPVADARHYSELMGQVRDERPVAVTIERGAGKEKERIRLTTRYVLRKREETLTVRLQAEYLPDGKEISIVSRAIAALQITVPAEWVPAAVSWNGTQMATPQAAGCYLLTLQEPGSARPCGR